MASEQLHLTLCFIGEVDGAVFHDIREALHQVSVPAFSIRLDGVGCFPPRGRPRVVWVGVEADERLHRLHQKIYTRLASLGLALERRKFAPHITIARLKSTATSKVARYLEECGLFSTEPFTVENYRLYSSVLGRQGAVHTVEEEYELGDA